MTVQTIDELLASRSVPDAHPAVVALQRDGLETTNRGDLLRRAGRLAGGLVAAGLQRGDRVVILAPNSADWVASALGVMQAAGVVVPLDTQMPTEDLEHALVDSDPRFIFTTLALQERLHAVQERVQIRRFDANSDASDAWSGLLAPEPAAPVAEGQDPAAIFYTSGTTGPPKGVPLTHHNLSSNVEALCTQGLADHRDRVLVPLPFHHVYPFTVGILIPLTLGAPLIVPFSLVGPQIVRALRDGEATVMLGVPRLYEAIWNALQERVSGRGRMAARLFRSSLRVSALAQRRLGHRLGLQLGRRLFAGLHRRLAPRLRLVVSGGAALDPELGRKLQALGWAVATGYGLSETSPILTYNPPDRLRLDSAGRPLPGVEIAIDTNGRSEGTSEERPEGRGEVMARGPNVFHGYRNLPKKTAKVLDEQGWFRTGDLGELGSDGYLYLYGRESSMIVLSGGENVNPDRVESALQAAPEIREAGLLEHEDRLAVVVVPESDLLREATGEKLRERLEQAVREASRDLPSHHRPGMLRIAMDPLPRTRLGKLRRHKLQEMFETLREDDAAAKAQPEPIDPEAMAPEDQQLLSDPAAERTWQYLAERFHDLRLTPDSHLAQDLGIDSLSWVDLTLALRDRAGIDLDDAAIGRVESVRDLLQEAAGASEAQTQGEDLAAQLEDPEALLEPEQKALLEAPGMGRRLSGLLVLGPSRLIPKLLLRVEVQGRFPDQGPYLIAPRHISILDPLVLLRRLDRRQLQSLYWAGWTGLLFSNPFNRAFSRSARILPIDPGAAPRSSLALAAACLKRGYSLIWFPEGRRSPDGSLQRLRPGVGLVLRAQPVPVIPVWIEGTREAMPPGQRLPRPGRVRVIIGDPIPPESYGRDPREIVDTLHAALAALGDRTHPPSS